MVSIIYPNSPSAPDLSGFEQGLASLGDIVQERRTRKALDAYVDSLYGGQGGRGDQMSLAALQPRQQQVARAPATDIPSQRVAQAHAASGGNPPVGAIEAYIRHAAKQRGIDPDVAVRVAMSEGGVSDPTRQSDIVKDGVREQSYGPFQLFMNGGLGNEALAAGIDPRQDWKGGIDFALDKAKEGGWGPWYGAAKVGIGERDGLDGPQSALTASGAVQMAQNAPAGNSAGLLPPREVMQQLFRNKDTREFGVLLAREAQKARLGDPEAALRMEKLRLEVEKERTQAPGLVELFDEATGQPYKARYNAQTGEYERVGGIKAPNGSELSIGPNGEVTFRQGSGLGKVTEAQSKDINYFQRGRATLPTINEFEKALASPQEAVAGSVPYIGNFMISPDYQRGLQAGREFLAAILRKDTGAAVTKAEFDLYGPMFLPTPGDSAEVLGQKRVARERAMQAIQTGLGGMGEALPEPQPNPKGSGLPSGVSEEDVEFTMKKHGLTREQVLERLNSAP